MKVFPRFDFSSEVPSAGSGGFNKDGSMGIYGKGSAEEIQGRLDARRFNEYERVMALLSDGLGDYDFTETFPGLKITNASDAIRRLKTELAAALALFAGNEDQEELDTRLYGILTDWVKSGLSTLGSIYTDYYTPGLSMSYEPSFEIVKTDTDSIRVLGGRINIPGKEMIVAPSLSPDGAYDFSLPETEIIQNVEFVFGPGMTLPAGAENRVDVINGRFNLPVQTLALNYQGKPLGTLVYGLGVGVKEFKFVDISGTTEKDVSIVLVSGTVDSGYIDTNSPVSYFLGVDTFRAGNIETVPAGFDVLVDPLSSSGKTDSVSDGTYYAYFYVPDTKGYFLGVKTDTGLMAIEEALITENGELKAQDYVFPLYFIKGEFNPVASALGSVVEESKIFTYRRVGTSLEHSINSSFTDDALIDVRRFKNKPRPIFIPPWVPKDFLEGNIVLRSDIHGNVKKVLPMFFPFQLRHTKERYTLEKIKDLTLAESQEITEINHQAYTPFSYIYFDKKVREDNERVLARLVTGADGIFPRILGFYGKVEYLGNEYTDLTLIDNTLKLEVLVETRDGILIYKGETQDLSNIYSWVVDNTSRLTIEALTDLEVKLKLSENVGSAIYVKDFNVVLSPIYTKIGTTGTGSAFKELYDIEYGVARESNALVFSNTGELTVTRRISKPESQYLTKEYYDVSSVTTTFSVELDIGLSALPKWWKSVFSQLNQYLLVYAADNTIKLVRINIANPKDFTVEEIDFNMLPGEEIKATLLTGDIYSVGLDLEITVEERPKVIGIVQGSNYFYESVISYNDGITNSPDQQTVYTQQSIDMSQWVVLGTYRNYLTDPQNSTLPANLDVLDGRKIVLKNSTRVQIHDIPYKMYMNYIGYISKEDVVKFEFVYSSNFSSTGIIVGYLENRRNTEDRPKDGSTDRRFSSIGLWSNTDNKFVMFSLYRDLTNSNVFEGTKISYSSNFVTDSNLVSYKFIRSGVFFEVGGLDAVNDPHRYKYQPYRGTLIGSENNIDYDLVINYSLGTVVVAADSAENRYNIQKETGAAWSEDNVSDFLERYKTLQSRVDSLIYGRGIAYRLNIFNSDPVGLTREISTTENFLNVVNYRTYPDPAVFGSENGIARRVGRFSKNQDSETVHFLYTSPRTAEQLSDRPEKYNITLFVTPSWYSGFASWPTYLPSKQRGNLVAGDEAEIFVELGSASGAGIDSGLYNLDEKLESYEAEYVRKGLQLDLFEMHSTRTTLSKYPDSIEDVLESEIVLPNDRPFIKYGQSTDSLGITPGNSPYVPFSDMLSVGDSNFTITTNINDTQIPMGFVFDVSNLYRKKFEKVNIILTTDSAPLTGILRVVFEDDSGVLYDQEHTFNRYSVIHKGERLEVISLVTDYDLLPYRNYKLKLSVKTGQSFSTITTRKDSYINDFCYSIRYLSTGTNQSLSNSIWNSSFDIKLGGSSIWTPYVKKLNAPWEVRIGSDYIKDKPIPFITSSREYGLILSRNSGQKVIATCERDQWKEERVPGTNGMEPVFYEKKYDGTQVLLLVDRVNQELLVYRKESGVWVQHVVPGITPPTTGPVVACNSSDRGVIIGAIPNEVDNSITYFEIDAYTPVIDYQVVDTTVPDTDVLELKIFGIPTGETLLGIKRTTGSDYQIMAVVLGSSIYTSVIDTIPNTFTDVTLNQVTFFGSSPYIVYSWGSPSNYFIKVMTAPNFGSIPNASWAEHAVTLSSGGGSGYTAGTPVTAFFAKPGYLIYSPGINQDYKVHGWNVNPSPIDLYHSFLGRQKEVSHIVQDVDDNFFWISAEGGYTTGLYSWALAVPVPYYNGIITQDEWNHNNWIWIDRQGSRFYSTVPFWNQLRVKHGIRYKQIVEDTLKSISSVNSTFTDKIESLISLASTARLQTNVDIGEIFNALMTGMHLGWSTQYTGTDLTKPDTKTYSKGLERIRLTMSYNTSGPAVNKLSQIVYEYSEDSGSNYSMLGIEQFTYNGSGLLQSSSFV